MSKYNNNNFSRAPGPDSPMRFNKRQRFGANSNGGNNPQRFMHQNQPGYQYSQNRNNATDYNKSNQYENGTNRHFYNSPKRINYNHQQQNKQSLPYSHKSIVSPSQSSSKFSTSSKNVSNLVLPQTNTLSAQKAPPTTVSQNTQHQQQQFTSNIIDSSNYYGFGYNFYPTYNTDIIGTVPSTGSFSGVDGLTPYMWQTITSTPPPKLTQKQQPPLPQEQPPPLPQEQPPPLPEQQPTPILPPLPNSNNLPRLQPPPPIPPECLSDSSSTTKTSQKTDKKEKRKDQESAAKTIVKMKAKRKAMSVRYKLSKFWSEKDALLALKAEETSTKKLTKDIILVIRFPDPEISREIVKCYSPDIESVHFQLTYAPRYCLVHLKPGADVEKTMDHLSKISFGTGYLSVEIKQIPHRTHTTKLNEIDPFTLYVGNLPTTIACKTLKEHFPGATRIDIGFAQRMKYTRYAFIRYQNVQQAIEAYKRMLDKEIGGRTVMIRFRRLTAVTDSNNSNGENNGDVTEEHISQATITPEDSITQLSQDSRDDTCATDNIVDTNNGNDSNDLAGVTEKETTETGKNTDNSAPETSTAETNETDLPTNETITQEKSSEMHRNIKPEPDVDPEDIVIHKNTVPSRLTDNTIKREEEHFAQYIEFFEKPSNQNHAVEKSNRSDIHSLSSTADERDNMSPLSNTSLGDFLQTCNRRQISSDNIEELGPPPTKINKITCDNVETTIKVEPLEKNNARNRESLHLFTNDSAQSGVIKQEDVQDSENLNTKYKNSSVGGKKVAVGQNARDSNCQTSCNDDIVPSTAIFYQRDYQNVLTSSVSACDYDEFYETRVSSEASASCTNVKKEISDIPAATNTIATNQQILQSESINRNLSACHTSKEKSGINSTPPSINDDLVPAQNILGSYRIPLESSIKMETEHADIFSVPFNTTSYTNDETISSRNDSDTSLTSHSTICENITETSTKTDAAEDNDEDVVIVSDNIKRPSYQAKSNNLILNNSCIPRQTDLVSFTYKTVSSVSLRSLEVSKLVHRDHLDKLYEQLDADSDIEL